MTAVLIVYGLITAAVGAFAATSWAFARFADDDDTLAATWARLALTGWAMRALDAETCTAHIATAFINAAYAPVTEWHLTEPEATEETKV